MSKTSWTQAEADAITGGCGAPTRWLTTTDGEVRYRPDSDGDLEISACVIRRLKESGKENIFFVGNEAVREVEN